MKPASYHLVNSRALTTFNTISNELELHPQKNYLFDLSYLRVLEVNGDRAIEFLQGQFTCDVNSVSDIQIMQGAQCNLQGRILTMVDIINWNGVKVVLPEDLSGSTIKSLNKTAMLSRVALDKNSELRVLGFYLQNRKDLVPDSHFFPDNLYALVCGADYCCYHLGNNFYIFLGQAEFADEVSQPFAAQSQLLGSLTWHNLRLAKRQIDIYPETRGLFLPHRLDLHQTPYLSFNKGCYKGQEIIARMHYKAIIKHHLEIHTIHTNENIHSGQKLLKEAGGAEVGELIDYSLSGNKQYLIAISVLKDFSGALFLEGHTQPIKIC